MAKARRRLVLPLLSAPLKGPWTTREIGPVCRSRNGVRPAVNKWRGSLLVVLSYCFSLSLSFQRRDNFMVFNENIYYPSSKGSSIKIGNWLMSLFVTNLSWKLFMSVSSKGMRKLGFLQIFTVLQSSYLLCLTRHGICLGHSSCTSDAVYLKLCCQILITLDMYRETRNARLQWVRAPH